MTKSVIDLSKMTPQAIKQNVLTQTITNPISVYPFFVGLMLLAFWFIFEAGWIFAAVGSVLVILGPISWAINYFGRYDFYSTKYFRKLRQENEKTAREKLKTIQTYLDEHGFDQAAQQVTKIQTKMETFERVLKKKFQEGEMSYARYHSVAEQVFLNSLQTLENLVTQLEAISTIDINYIEQRLGELNSKHGLTENQISERASLENRKSLKLEALESFDRMLAQNENAMTELDSIATKIAKSKTDGRDTDAILSESINRLNQLGHEAEKNWG